MARNQLPSAKQVRQRFALYGLCAALVTLLIVSLYVSLLSDLEAADWSTFGFSMGLVGLLSGGASVLWLRRAVEPIANWLETGVGDPGSSPQTLNAFKAVIALPSDSQRTFTITWFCAAIGVPVILTLMGAGGVGYRRSQLRSRDGWNHGGDGFRVRAVLRNQGGTRADPQRNGDTDSGSR